MKTVFLMACVVILGSLFSISVRADTNIDNCTTLNTTGETYLLTQNISCTGAVGIFINNDSITLDCQGFGITNPGDEGIEIGYSNAIVKNCIVHDCYDAVFSISDASNVTIKNNTIYNNEDDGIYFYSSFSTIENNTIYNNSYAGIDDYGSNNTIKSNNLFDNYYSIEFEYINPTNISVYNNLMNQTMVSDTFIEGNYFNTTNQTGARIYTSGTRIGGNYWTNSTGNGYSDTCADADTDGFCDVPYDVGNNTGCPNECGPNTDYLPLSPLYEEPPCVPSWNCTAFGPCANGYQNRTCTDLNDCGENRTKPAEWQACLNPIPNATFNISSTCCPISTFYCTDNETLVQLWNTSQGISWAVEDCQNGCDNVTSSCSPAPFEANIWTLVIIIVIIAAIAVLYRWSRR